MAHAHRTARGWLIFLTVLLLAFVAAVVWVVVARTQGSAGATATTVSEAQDGGTATADDDEATADDDEATADDDEATNHGDGWFTEDQATRGDEAYAESCASCHGPQLEGGTGPALTGDTFWDRWGGETVHTFFEVTSHTMPQEAPGSLALDTYADITAHVLRVNGFPTGDDELPPDDEHLAGLAIEEPSAGGEGEDEQAAPEGDAEDATAEDGSDEDAQDATATDEPSTAAAGGDGWFADAQVQAGRATYAEHCARCHGSDLQGDPPLVGGGFAERYGTVWALYQYVRQTMPLDHPGSLDNQSYLDAVAYLLDENGYPVGDQRQEPIRATLEALELDAERSEPAAGEQDSSEERAARAEGDEPAEGGDRDDEAEGDDQAEGAEDAEGDDTAEGRDGDGDADGADDESEGASDAEDADPGEAAADDGGSGEGHYDREQAERGQEPYAQHCAQCHGDSLQGQPPLTGDAFLGTFESVWDLFEYTRDNMPQGDPGSLDDETYGDIVAYVLSENDLPDGGEELGPDQEDAMRDLPLDPEAAEGGAQAEDDGEADDTGEPDDTGDADDTGEADGASEADAEGPADADGRGMPALATLEIDARPANLTVNILGPDGLARRAVGAQTLTDLQPGLYVIAGSRGHEGVTVNVRVAAGETARVRLVLDELSRSADVPEEPAIPTTEVPAIPRDLGEGVLIGAAPATALGSTSVGGGTAPNTDFAAGRGQQAYAVHCARCHGAELEGNVAPALAGDVFFERWGGHPVDWFYFQARAAMPPHGAGSLSEQTYADIVVYVLTTNGVLEGFETFAPGDEAFRNLVIEPRRTTDGREALEDRVDRMRETLHGPQDVEEPSAAGPVMPVEWPGDPGVAPIGKDGDRVAPTGGGEDAPGDGPEDEPDGEDEGRVDDADLHIDVDRPMATRSRAA